MLRLDSSLRDAWLETDDGWRLELPTGWMQGRSVFGGLTAAAATALAHRELGDDTWQLRTISTQLPRPLPPGLVSGRVVEIRRGKNACFVEVRLDGDEGAAVICHFVFVRPRLDATDVEPRTIWTGPDPESRDELPYLEGLTPEFTQHVAFRWAEGGYPYSGSDEAQFSGYCRFRSPAGGPEGLVALLDVWPCPTLAKLSGPAAASTVNWSAHLLEIPAEQDGWFGFRYETVVGRGGFHTVNGRLFDASGRLVATSEQLAVVFG